MKKLVFFLIILISLSQLLISQEQNIEAKCPGEVEVNSEFKCNIKLIDFDLEIYDVKIDLFGDDSRISRIYNPEKKAWQSTHYYVNNAINLNEANNEDFLLKITKDFSGTASVNIRIRKSGSSSYKSFDSSIKVIKEEILNNEEVNSEDEEEEEEDSEKNKENEEIEKMENSKPKEISNNSNINQNITIEETKTITIKSKKEYLDIYYSKEQKFINQLPYLILLMIILVIILLIIIKKLK